MEYIWPARKNRRKKTEDSAPSVVKVQPSTPTDPSPRDPSPGPSNRVRKSLDHTRLAPVSIRKLGASRSFTDLRSAGSSPMSALQMNRSTDALPSPTSGSQPIRRGTSTAPGVGGLNDAAIMKTRSAQKTFVAVDIASISVLLSIQKEAAFLLRDARINTRDLHYRNQTWSVSALTTGGIFELLTGKLNFPLVRGARRAIHSFRSDMERLGQDGIAPTVLRGPPSSSRTDLQDQTDRFKERSTIHQHHHPAPSEANENFGTASTQSQGRLRVVKHSHQSIHRRAGVDVPGRTESENPCTSHEVQRERQPNQ